MPTSRRNGLPTSLWTRPIPQDRAEAEDWVTDATVAFGGAYHPDTTDYVQRDGKPTFSPTMLKAFTAREDAAHDLLREGGPDIYDVSIRALKEQVAGYGDIDID